MSDPGVGSELGACAQESHFGLEVCLCRVHAVSSEVTWGGGQPLGPVEPPRELGLQSARKRIQGCIPLGWEEEVQFLSHLGLDHSRFHSSLLHAHSLTCTQIHMHTHSHVHTHVHTLTCAHMHTRAPYTCTHSHAHTCTHSHVHTLSPPGFTGKVIIYPLLQELADKELSLTFRLH